MRSWASRKLRRTARSGLRAALVAAFAAAPVGALDEGSPEPIDAVKQPGALPSPGGLEGLFELPSELDRSFTLEKRGGRTRGEWRVAFTDLNESLAEEQKLLEEAELELDEVAASTSAWQVGAAIPGLENAEAPLDYRLRQRIRRHRAEVERLERRLRELRVEADLAGVPAEWRG